MDLNLWKYCLMESSGQLYKCLFRVKILPYIRLKNCVEGDAHLTMLKAWLGKFAKVICCGPAWRAAVGVPSYMGRHTVARLIRSLLAQIVNWPSSPQDCQRARLSAADLHVIRRCHCPKSSPHLTIVQGSLQWHTRDIKYRLVQDLLFLFSLQKDTNENSAIQKWLWR